MIPKSSLFTITLKLKCVIRRDGHTYCHIFISTHWPSTNELMKWTGPVEGGFQHSLRFDGEQKNETKQDCLKNRPQFTEVCPFGAPGKLPTSQDTLEIRDQERQYLWQKKTNFTWLIDYFIDYFISLDWLITEYAGCYLVLGIQWEVKIGMVHDSQSLQFTQHYEV